MSNYITLHNHFRFNGFSYSKEELKNLSYSFVKEGQAHESAIGEFFLDWFDDNETIKVTTSGSTGKPKELPLHKSKMVNSAFATGDYFQLKPKDKALLCLSADYIAGKMMLVRAMVLGLELDCIAPISNPLLGNTKQYDFCAMVPLQVESSIVELSNIKKLIVGGAAMSSSLIDRLQHTTCQVYATYGMTETITHIAVKKINDLGSHFEENYFKALPNVNCAIDERNCLVIEAPEVLDQMVVTNDVVNLISDFEFEWLGRFDTIINSGGIKLFPEQIEAKLAHIISNRFFVTGIPDEKLGQRLALIVEGQVNIEKLRQRLSSQDTLDIYENPKKIFLLPEFVATETGKIQRKKTLELL